MGRRMAGLRLRCAGRAPREGPPDTDVVELCSGFVPVVTIELGKSSLGKKWADMEPHAEFWPQLQD
jgi:hypothetical protein